MPPTAAARRGSRICSAARSPSFLGPTGDVHHASKAGKVRVLGTSGSERNAFLPDVPTMREQGFKIALREWYAFFMPARASAERCSAPRRRCRR